MTRYTEGVKEDSTDKGPVLGTIKQRPGRWYANG